MQAGIMSDKIKAVRALTQEDLDAAWLYVKNRSNEVGESVYDMIDSEAEIEELGRVAEGVAYAYRFAVIHKYLTRQRDKRIILRHKVDLICAEAGEAVDDLCESTSSFFDELDLACDEVEQGIDDLCDTIPGLLDKEIGNSIPSLLQGREAVDG